MFYILDDKGRPVESEDYLSFGDIEDRRVGWTEHEGVVVSTVFLHIDHNHLGIGPPVLFETMTERSGTWEDEQRYCTLAEAVKGHKDRVLEVFGSKAPTTQWGSLVERLDSA